MRRRADRRRAEYLCVASGDQGFQGHRRGAIGGVRHTVPAGCFTSPDGAMGFHCLKEANVGTLTVMEPQLVMYQPQANGSMKLVGVEYIVPGEPNDTPPVLFDREFQYNATFQVWALHVWAWESNPKGMYADWNPNVTGDHAGAVSPRRHH